MDNQRQLALLLIYERDFEYFGKLKALYSSQEWPEVVEEILKEFEKTAYPPEIYVNILIEGKLFEQLLRYCQRYPDKIISLYSYLVEDYLDEVSFCLESISKMRPDAPTNAANTGRSAL